MKRYGVAFTVDNKAFKRVEIDGVDHHLEYEEYNSDKTLVTAYVYTDSMSELEAKELIEKAYNRTADFTFGEEY